MAKGRKSIPSKLVALRGGSKHTHRPARDDEPQPQEKLPNCPRHLDGEAQKEWRRTGKLLKELGLISELDRSVFAAHCAAWAQWVEATQKLAEMGMVFRRPDGMPAINPWKRIADEASATLLKTGTLLGLSPSARASLRVPKKEQQSEEEKFLNAKRD